LARDLVRLDNRPVGDADIPLSYYRGPTETVIDALIAAELEGATLELQADHPDEFQKLLDSVNAKHPELAEANGRATQAFKIGPIGFGVGPHLVPIEGDNLARLRALVAAGEVFLWQLDVRDAQGHLVWAPDLGDNDIWVGERLPADAVERMRAVLGDGLEPPSPGA
jgi:hypothetical protein